MESKKGKLVIIIGVDGAGKTTCLKKVEQCMIEDQKSCICLERKLFNKYANEFDVSNYIVNYMTNLGSMLWGAKKTDPVTELPDDVWLYMHAIWYNVFQKYILNQALLKYDYVFLDSWYYKIMARFMVNAKYKETMFDQVFGKLYPGDIGIMLDTDINLCLQRKNELSHGEVGRHHMDIMESNPQRRFLMYQKQVRDQMLKLCKQNNWLVCNITRNWENSDYKQVVQWILQQ